MHTIRQIPDEKGRDIHAVKPDDTVLEAIRRMAELGIGALLVMDDGRLLGLISERDYARKVILADRRSHDTRVADIMSAPAITIDARATAKAGLALMTNKRIRHLPVLDQGKLVGVVSVGDLVYTILGDQQDLIEQLERYVTG